MNKKKLKNTILKYAACIVPGGLVSYIVIIQYDYNSATEVFERYRILCDAFTIPGVILVMAYLLVLIANAGAFDGIGYIMKIAVRKLIPFLSAHYMPEKYYDYLERKKNSKIKGVNFILFSGILFLVFALIFMLKFYQVYQP